MALNFPSNPGVQNPVNEFSPTSTPEASTNGVSYIQDGEKWTAETTGAGFGDLYLSRITDDEAQGSITFDKVTTHGCRTLDYYGKAYNTRLLTVGAFLLD